MSYEFDVFLSYKSGIFGRWVEEVFYDFFEGYLAEELGRAPRIFFDRQKIEGGAAWEMSLKKALADSACLVAVWSVGYFASSWCRRELNMLRKREELFGFRTPHNPMGLIFPVVVHDGQRFPPYAAQIQALHCAEFARIDGALQKSERYIEFQDKLFEWVPSVVHAIQNAPAWDQAWRTLAWVDDAVPAPAVAFAPPTLG